MSHEKTGGFQFGLAVDADLSLTTIHEAIQAYIAEFEELPTIIWVSYEGREDAQALLDYVHTHPTDSQYLLNYKIKIAKDYHLGQWSVGSEYILGFGSYGS